MSLRLDVNSLLVVRDHEPTALDKKEKICLKPDDMTRSIVAN